MKYNTPGRDSTKYYGTFWGSCNLVPQPGTCSSMPATGDDHVVRLHIGSPGRAETEVRCGNTV